jgi:hypothetical protein
MDGILITNRNGIKACQWRGDKAEKRERKKWEDGYHSRNKGANVNEGVLTASSHYALLQMIQD